jgi:methionyl-tRNA formyltransferase
MALKTVFMGTPPFAVAALEALAREHSVLAVYTQPDRPAGRGRETAMPAVKRAALALGIPVRQPVRVREPGVLRELRGDAPDAIIVVGYGQIIPQNIIDLPRLGVINVHASLLPRYRGAAPVQWAIAEGETKTGVTTMQIDAGLDTGGLLLSWETEIGPDERAPQLSGRLAAAGAKLLLETLAGLEAGTITPRPQDDSLATLAPVLKKEDGRIDWNWPASKVYNRLRGFDPWPGGWTTFRGQTLHIRGARPAAEHLPPGAILRRGKQVFAGCGEGSLELLEVQMEGRKRVCAIDFINGVRLGDNETLGVSR